METTTINNLFIEDVIDNLRTIAKCESIMNQNTLISSDMEYDINAFKEGMENGLLDYYFAIRQHGSMSHYNAEALKEQINKKWDETYIAIKVMRSDAESEIYLMTINRK